MGDLNAHHPMWSQVSTNRNGRIVMKMLDSLELILLNDASPTRIANTHNHMSSPFLTLCSHLIVYNFSWHVIKNSAFSDHFPIICEYLPNKNNHEYDNQIIRTRNWNRFQELIATSNFNETDTSYEELIRKIQRARRLACKRNDIRKKNTPVWWTEECDRVVREKNKKICTNTRRVIRKTKKKKFREFCCSLNRNAPITKVWKTVKSFNSNFNTKKTPLSNLWVNEFLNLLQRGSHFH